MTYFINTTMIETIYPQTKSATPNKGETWYVRLPDAKSLTTAVVTDLTAHTVELTKDGGWQTSRYIRDDIQFVERVYL